jgi:Restriction alleviation protein Lar
MTDAPEILPCPFCGGAASVWTTSAYSCDSSDHVLGCAGCCIYMPFASVFESAKPDAEDVKAWNQRASLADLYEQAAKLKTVLQREADTIRRRDAREEKLEAKIERLRAGLQEIREYAEGCRECGCDRLHELLDSLEKDKP